MNSVIIASAKITLDVMEGKNLDKSFEKYFKENSVFMDNNKIRQIKAICYDSLRYFKTLDFFLQNLVPRKIQNKLIQQLLIVAMNQLTYGNKKNYALVDEVVNLAKKIDPKQSGFTNAVLRNFLRNKEDLIKKTQQTLESKYNFPLWWIKKLQNSYPNDWESIIHCQNMHPPMTLRMNQTKISLEKYKDYLTDNGIDFCELSPTTIVLNTPKSIDEIIGFNEGWVTIQDFGAQLVKDIMDIKDGQSVLDACSAPGGKTGHILECFDVNLVALEIDSKRAQRVHENLTRLGLTAKVVNASLSKINNWWDKKKFDRILLDVPCSGSGVVRRNIDIKWLRRERDFEKFRYEQVDMLENVWPLLKKKGKLLYVTCSIFEEENVKVIEQFMKKNKDVNLLKIKFPINTKRLGNQLIPSKNHDGFYYELLEKI
ncbi:MAG: 16S rRNA (cytosine(967)-C(5))-methyltransferase RsmB [Methylophilaceae bacterium]|jgi:16S rRNA (cytosine967-C5)-methyltransferase|nr:16S rRNA (cytosine(967)-C(5))-methyltransferase RsmB [Methylophilaceae bacterium]MBL6726532.1 16S rRNA (cytosine(967)-C(5))-methyltransferase RsmB [Methylophilaceae bacterium]MBL6728471.1 16S rRNA (cytosine(967)-C(5))-methyltransferase RsmB [Methylophilaceae bacterium]